MELLQNVHYRKEHEIMSEKHTQLRPAFHGSDVEQIEKYYGIPKESIVRFGANVNPLGLSDSVRESLSEHLDIITSYPDRDYRSLRQVIAPTAAQIWSMS